MPEHNPKIDEYIENAPAYAQPILVQVRDLFHRACPEIEETVKWGMPHFEHQGIVGSMAAHKKHLNIGFWKGTLIEVLEGRLAQVGKTGMSFLRIETPDDLPDDDTLIAAIREGVRLNEEGIDVPRSKPAKAKKELEVPEDLHAELAQNAAARETFEGFSYSDRKEYIEWLTGAKREATRTKRLAQAIEWMAEGKPRNWKYMKKWH